MIITRSPLRIPLGGGGTDLPSYYSVDEGFILSAAIDKYVYIYVNRPAADDFIRVKYSIYEQVSNLSEIQHDLVRPALEMLGIDQRIEIVSMADIPSGTGMGSSGSYLTSLLTALYELKRERVPVSTLAEQACHIEMDLAGHPVGKHDHYLAAFGGLTILKIDRGGNVTVTPLDITLDSLDGLRNGLVLFFTGLTRSSRAILQQQKDDTKIGEANVIDSLKKTKDLGYKIKEALELGDLDKFGQYLHLHWENKKRRSNKISNPEIDKWYDIAMENGALGGKIMGAGGGGFLLFYCPNNSSKANVRNSLSDAGLREVPFGFDFEGAKVVLNF